MPSFDPKTRPATESEGSFTSTHTDDKQGRSGEPKLVGLALRQEGVGVMT